MPGQFSPADLDPLFEQFGQEFNVDPTLAKMVGLGESRFNQGAVSPKGAIGVMQLMPGTAQDLGVNPYDVTDNIRGGVKYLAQGIADGEARRAAGQDIPDLTAHALRYYYGGPRGVMSAATEHYPAYIAANYAKLTGVRQLAAAGNSGTVSAPPPAAPSAAPAPDGGGPQSWEDIYTGAIAGGANRQTAQARANAAWAPAVQAEQAARAGGGGGGAVMPGPGAGGDGVAALAQVRPPAPAGASAGSATMAGAPAATPAIAAPAPAGSDSGLDVDAIIRGITDGSRAVPPPIGAPSRALAPAATPVAPGLAPALATPAPTAGAGAPVAPPAAGMPAPGAGSAPAAPGGAPPVERPPPGAVPAELGEAELMDLQRQLQHRGDPAAEAVGSQLERMRRSGQMWWLPDGKGGFLPQPGYYLLPGSTRAPYASAQAGGLGQRGQVATPEGTIAPALGMPEATSTQAIAGQGAVKVLNPDSGVEEYITPQELQRRLGAGQSVTTGFPNRAVQLTQRNDANEAAKNAAQLRNLAEEFIHYAGEMGGGGAGQNTINELRRIAQAAGKLSGLPISDQMAGQIGAQEAARYAAQGLVSAASRQQSANPAFGLYQDIENAKMSPLTSPAGVQNIGRLIHATTQPDLDRQKFYEQYYGSKEGQFQIDGPAKFMQAYRPEAYGLIAQANMPPAQAAAAIQHLRDHPDTRAAFDQMFQQQLGIANASNRVLGPPQPGVAQ